MLDLCNVKKLPVLDDVREIFPMIWRFLPMLDLQVDILMSRDLDSLINERDHRYITSAKDSTGWVGLQNGVLLTFSNVFMLI